MVEHPIRSAGRQSHGSPPPGHPHTIPAASPTPGADDLWIDLDEPMADAQATSDYPAISSAPLEQIAYVNVLRDLLSGSNTLSVSREEADLAWQIFTPTLDQVVCL